MAEAGWQYLLKIAVDQTAPPRVLDFGTGSGCLAVTLAVKCPQAELVGLDVSEPALTVARQNAARHGVLERIAFLQGDRIGIVPDRQPFHLLVSNPPYIPSATIPELQPEVRDFDPRSALDGGADGLDVIRQLAREGRGCLVPGGLMMMEFGDGQEARVRELFLAAGWLIQSVVPDNSGCPRILIAQSPVS